MHHHDFVNDGKPQSGALNLFAGPVDAIKTVEYFGKCFFGYSHACIADADYPVVIPALNIDGNPAFFGREFDGVTDKIC